MAGSSICPCIRLPEKWKKLDDSETTEENDYEQETSKYQSESESPFVERSFINIARELWICKN